jgi:glycosyltransferase involved in cell wall biosynthesis
MKKLMVIVSYFPKHKDDPGDFVYDLTKKLKEKGFNISVLTPHVINSKFKENINGLEVYRFPYFYPFEFQKLAYGSGIPYNLKNSYLAKIQTPLFFLSELFFAIWVIRKEKVEVIHSHWLLPQGLVGAICRNIFGISHIATLHSSEITLVKKIPAGRKIAEFIVNNTNVIVSVSLHRANELLTLISSKVGDVAKEKMQIIPMGVYLSDSRNEINKDELKVKYGINSKFVVLFVGRLVEVKGCEYLIEGFKGVVDRFNDAQLIIVGAGPLEIKLRKIVEGLNMKEYVRFEGFVEHSKIGDYYSLSDIVVFPSIVDSSGYEEGLPVVLLEALAVGKPIVATRTKGAMEIIKEGWNGSLVEQKNPEQIAEKVLVLLDNEELRAKLSKNALETGKKYDWAVITEKYLKIINEGVVDG